MSVLGSVGVMCTRLGLNVLSAGVAGARIIFSRVAIGDGEMTVETREEYESSVLELTDIINHKMDVPIVECKNLGNGYMMLHVTKNNAEVPEGFFARERAVYAIDQASGEEVLFAYINTGDASSYIPGNTGPIAKVIDFSVYVVIQNAAKVEAILDASFAYVGLNRFNEHVESAHPHPNIPNHYGDVTQTQKIWATDNDNHLHQISLDNLKAELASDSTENSAQIKELELLMAVKNELGLEANLLMVEDFKPASEVDEYSVKVVSCARGGRLVGVDTDEGITKGKYYWITDNVNQELIQVKSISYSTDYYHISLEQPLTYDYDVSRTAIYRTTYSDFGAADTKSLTYSFKGFTGIEANIDRIIEADLASTDGIILDGYATMR